MSKLETVVEELKMLPPHQLAEAERVIRALRRIGTAAGHPGIAATAGKLTTAEADEWEHAIHQDCREIDRRDAGSW